MSAINAVCSLPLRIPMRVDQDGKLICFVTAATDYNNGKLHINVWTGSSTVNGGSTQEQCEDNLTPDGSQTVVRQPASTYAVDSKYKLLSIVSIRSTLF